MARLSHYTQRMLGLASLLTTGCIVPDAPQYGSPNETPVFIQQSSISPDPRSIIHVDNVDGQTLDFNFKFQSEDLPDDGLIYALYINYKHDNATIVDHRPKTPSTLDVARPINWHFVLHSELFPTKDAGCETITITVLHAQYWDDETSTPFTNIPPDMAAVTWFVDFNDPNGMLPLSSCPDTASMTSETTP